MRKGRASPSDWRTCGARLASLIRGRGLVALTSPANGFSTGRCAERRLVETNLLERQQPRRTLAHTWLDCSLTWRLPAEASWQHSCDLSPLGPQTKLPHNYSLQMLPPPNDTRGLFVCQSVAGQKQHAFLSHVSFHNFSSSFFFFLNQFIQHKFNLLYSFVSTFCPSLWKNTSPITKNMHLCCPEQRDSPSLKL